jgi:hypothetical protein
LEALYGLDIPAWVREAAAQGLHMHRDRVEEDEAARTAIQAEEGRIIASPAPRVEGQQAATDGAGLRGGLGMPPGMPGIGTSGAGPSRLAAPRAGSGDQYQQQLNLLSEQIQQQQQQQQQQQTVMNSMLQQMSALLANQRSQLHRDSIRMETNRAGVAGTTGPGVDAPAPPSGIRIGAATAPARHITVEEEELDGVSNDYRKIPGLGLQEEGLRLWRSQGS